MELHNFTQQDEITNEEFEFSIDLEGAHVRNDTTFFSDPIDLSGSGAGVYRDSTLIGRIFVYPYTINSTTFNFVVK